MNVKSLARVAGILFITATATTIVSQILIDPIIDDINLLFKLSGSITKYRIGLLFELINAFACLGIGISVYSVLHKKNEFSSIGYLSFRAIEATLAIVAVIFYVILINFIQLKEAINSIIDSDGEIIINLLIKGHSFTFLLVLIAFNIGAFFLYTLLYRYKLVPVSLSIWGGAGSVLLLVANGLEFFHIEIHDLIGSFLYAPIALNEMALAFWLIWKGYNTRSLEIGK